jgi:hypothetical protein
MSDAPRDLSCTAKLARVVLENQGPLSPTEVAAEARLSEADAEDAVSELVDSGIAECVCGVCSTRESVYALVDDGPAASASDESSA